MNPCAQPASVVFVGARAARLGIGSQVAFRLALEHFAEGITSTYGDIGSEAGASMAVAPDPVAVLEAGFRTANQGVYQFGHKLAAGGRLAASLIGVVLSRSNLAVGRVGLGSAYLFRDGHLYPFFEEVEGLAGLEQESIDGANPNAVKGLSFVGINSLVDVELSSVPMTEDDCVVVFSRPLSENGLSRVAETLDGFGSDVEDEEELSRCNVELCRAAFANPETLSYGFLARIGPEAIYLAEIADGRNATGVGR